ncbi:polymer-forming cytoskeletal protein [soil metagenome]
MAIWKEPASAKKEPSLVTTQTPAEKRDDRVIAGGASTSPEIPAPAKNREAMESLIAADLTIEGKIEGSGHVRLVGKFKGDVHVEGDLTIEPGAKVTGSVRAGTVIIGGELEGNVDAASSVELLKTGLVHGDIKAGSLTVAAGSRMSGQAEFGGEEKKPPAPQMRVEPGSTP